MAGFKISISIIFYQTSIATKLPLILEKLQLVTSKFLIVLKDDIVLFVASIKSCRNVIHWHKTKQLENILNKICSYVVR